MGKRPTGNPSGRPRAFCEEQVLDAATLVFAQRGYEGASLTDLEAAMGINRVSIYATFGNKETLFVKAMTRYTEAGAKRLAQCLAAKSARNAVDRLLRDAVMKFTSLESPAVYFVTQAPLTRTDASEEAKRVMAQKRAVVELALRRRFDRAIEEGELAPATSSADLAGFYSVMIQGIALQAQHGGTTEDLLRVVDVGMTGWPGRAPTKARQRRGPMRAS